MFSQIERELGSLPDALSVSELILAELITATSIQEQMVFFSDKIGEQDNVIANRQNVNFFGPMRDSLFEVAANTEVLIIQVALQIKAANKAANAAAQAAVIAQQNADDGFWSNLFGHGGIIPIPGYEPGGVVGNGIWNRDSVFARFAGGGPIMLAGGEGVLTANATRSIGGGNVNDFINRNQALPMFGAVANDNSGLVTEIRALRAEVGALRYDARSGFATVEQSTRESASVVVDGIDRQTTSINRQQRMSDLRKTA